MSQATPPTSPSTERDLFAGSNVWAFACACGKSFRCATRAALDAKVLEHDERHQAEHSADVADLWPVSAEVES